MLSYIFTESDEVGLLEEMFQLKMCWTTAGLLSTKPKGLAWPSVASVAYGIPISTLIHQRSAEGLIWHRLVPALTAQVSK